MAEVLTEMLETNGYRVVWAQTALQARRMVIEEEPALVILDLILPDVDGLILCSDLRRMRDVPIVVVSGTNRKRDAVLSLRLGADDFVHKPFDLGEFEERLRAVLRRAA